MPKSFLTLRDYSPEEIRYLLEEAKDSKQHPQMLRREGPLSGKTLIILFQKRSTRTRVTAELAIQQLGGRSIFLGKDDIHLGVNESIRDTALVLGRMASFLLVRVFQHEDLEEFVKYAGIPVINALSDRYHPLQGLADLFTIEDKLGSLFDKKIAWVGDGNNVCHSLMIACAKMGIQMAIATPADYKPLDEVVTYCKTLPSSKIVLTNKPKDAVSQANVIATDTFISMGEEDKKGKKLKHFKEFQVTTSLLDHAHPEYIFMHCLPRHSDEVTDEVFYGPHSVVFDQAENRLYTFASVLKNL